MDERADVDSCRGFGFDYSIKLIRLSDGDHVGVRLVPHVSQVHDGVRQRLGHGHKLHLMCGLYVSQ